MCWLWPRLEGSSAPGVTGQCLGTFLVVTSGPGVAAAVVGGGRGAVPHPSCPAWAAQGSSPRRCTAGASGLLGLLCSRGAPGPVGTDPAVPGHRACLQVQLPRRRHEGEHAGLVLRDPVLARGGCPCVPAGTPSSHFRETDGTRWRTGSIQEYPAWEPGVVSWKAGGMGEGFGGRGRLRGSRGEPFRRGVPASRSGLLPEEVMLVCSFVCKFPEDGPRSRSVPVGVRCRSLSAVEGNSLVLRAWRPRPPAVSCPPPPPLCSLPHPCTGTSQARPLLR